MTTPKDAEYKQAQTLARDRASQATLLVPTLLVPTLPERINRLSPSERHDLARMICGLRLRKIIKRTLAEAFWNRETDEIIAAQKEGTMARSAAARTSTHISYSYDQVLTNFEPVVTQSEQPTLIEVPK